MEDRIADLFRSGLVVINVGVAIFGEVVRSQGIEVVQVNWKPPAGGDQEMINILDILGGA